MQALHRNAAYCEIYFVRLRSADMQRVRAVPGMGSGTQRCICSFQSHLFEALEALDSLVKTALLLVLQYSSAWQTSDQLVLPQLPSDSNRPFTLGGLGDSSAWAEDLHHAQEVDTALKYRADTLRRFREMQISILHKSGATRRERTNMNPVRVHLAGDVWFCGDYESFNTRANTFVMNSSVCHLPCQLVSERESADVVMESHFGAQEPQNKTYGVMTLESRDFEPEGLPLLLNMEYVDILASFSRHAEVTANYFDVPPLIGGKLEIALDKHKVAYALPTTFIANHSTLATFISSCHGDNVSLKNGPRQRLVSGLAAEGVTMDHFGSCTFGGNIRELPQEPATPRDRFLGKIQVMGTYKFALALENYVLYDYVTEKFYQAFASGALPIYLGAPNAADFAPPHSFINALEYTPLQLATLIRELEVDEQKYKSYFEWRRGKDSINEAFVELAANGYCGSRNDGLKTVCRICHTYHKFFDWHMPGDVGYQGHSRSPPSHCVFGNRGRKGCAVPTIPL